MDLNITTTILTPNTNILINSTTVLINGTEYIARGTNKSSFTHTTFMVFIAFLALVVLMKGLGLGYQLGSQTTFSDYLIVHDRKEVSEKKMVKAKKRWDTMVTDWEKEVEKKEKRERRRNGDVEADAGLGNQTAGVDSVSIDTFTQDHSGKSKESTGLADGDMVEVSLAGRGDNSGLQNSAVNAPEITHMSTWR